MDACILSMGTTMFNNILVSKEKETLSNFSEVNGDSLLLKNTMLPTESYQMLPRYPSKSVFRGGGGGVVTMDYIPLLPRNA